MRKTIILLISILLFAVFVGIAPSNTGLTAYCSFNGMEDWIYHIDSNFVYVEHAGGGSTSTIVTPDSYPASDPNFGDAIQVDGVAIQWYTNGPSPISDTLSSVAGTIEMWIAPDWNGTNQGGSGIGGTDTTSSLFVSGSTEWTGPLNIFLYNNGYPNDGGQLFAYWNDGTQAVTFNNSTLEPASSPADTYGTTKDWALDQWHHVAFCWDTEILGLYLDGGIVKEVDRTSIKFDMFSNNGYLFGRKSSASVINDWDGMVDDLAIWNHNRYAVLDTGAPTTPAPAPWSDALAAQNNYNASTSPWTSATDPNLTYVEMGTGTFTRVTPSTYPADNADFGDAVDCNGTITVLSQALGVKDWNETFNYLAGTFEVWIAPDWDGTNQGGSGIGGSGTYQDFIILGGSPWAGPFNVFLMNNGYPNDGGQLFAYWNDGTQSQTFENSTLSPAGPPADTNGTTADWVKDEWHHIAFCWDPNKLGLYLDGGIVMEVNRTNIDEDTFSSNGGYYFGRDTAGGIVESWDGMADDLAIWQYAKYTNGRNAIPLAPSDEISPLYSTLTVCSNYDDSNSSAWWSYTVDDEFDYTEYKGTGGTFTRVTPDSYPFDNYTFADAVDTNGPIALKWYSNDDTIYESLSGIEGTIEMWIAPDWDGTNQGGSGIGGTDTTSSLFVSGSTEWTGPLNIFLYNNGYPNDGGQLFAYWNDGIQSQIFENSTLSPADPPADTNGTTKDWVRDEWHHVAFCWNEDRLGLYLDGGVVEEVNRTNVDPDMFDNDGYLFGRYTGSAQVNCWDGMVDDFVIWKSAMCIDYDNDGYSTPTAPIALSVPTFNIMENSSIKDSSGTAAAYWETITYTGEYNFYVDSNEARTGSKCLAIEGVVDGHAAYYYEDVYLVKDVNYRFSGWGKCSGDGFGCLLLPYEGTDYYVEQYFNKYSTTWTEFTQEFKAKKTGRATLFLRNDKMGKTFFDDISIEIADQVMPPIGDDVGIISLNGKGLKQVIIPDDCNVSDYYSAFEAVRVLKEMTGTELAIVTESSMASDTGSIYINCAPDITDYTSDLNSVGDEGIVLDVNSNNIVCLGNTARGVYYAVQELFYLLDCRWYTPWDGGECIPSETTLTLTTQKIVHEPSFSLRGNAIANGYYVPPDMNTITSVDPLVWWDWEARNRMNGFKTCTAAQDPGFIRGHGAWDFAGHSIHTIIDPDIYWGDHNDYFPLVDYDDVNERTYTTPWANRAANVCVSNQDVIDICADFVIDYFDKHPEADRVHIGQMDVGAHCECSSCKALDPSGSVEWDKKADEPIAILLFTDRWMWFINQIADIVADSYPDKYVSTYAYAETLTVPIDPNNDPCDNVMVEISWSFDNLQDNNDWTAFRCFKHDVDDVTCPNNVNGLDVLSDWNDIAPGRISIYSYYSHYNSTGTAGAYITHDASFYSTLHDNGVRCINDEVGADALSAPLLLNLRKRLLWDIDTDIDDYKENFCEIVYGPAADDVNEFFTEVEEAISNSTKTHVNFNDFDIFTSAILSSLDTHLANAKTAAGTDTTLLAKIARLRISLIYTELKAGYGNAATLKSEADNLVRTYNIPVLYTVWPTLEP